MIQRLLILTCFCLTITLSTTYAQSGSLNDPLGKPAIWESLEENPADEGKWYEYMGKDWYSMSAREQDQLNSWRQELLLRLAQRRSAEANALKKAEEKQRKIEEAKKLSNPYAGKTPEEIKALKVKENMIMEENEEITELKDNIHVNFVILEDVYAEEFKRLGGNYVPYAEVHPDGNYSVSRWVEEQEYQMQTLKKAQVRRLHLDY